MKSVNILVACLLLGSIGLSYATPVDLKLCNNSDKIIWQNNEEGENQILLQANACEQKSITKFCPEFYNNDSVTCKLNFYSSDPQGSTDSSDKFLYAKLDSEVENYDHDKTIRFRLATITNDEPPKHYDSGWLDSYRTKHDQFTININVKQNDKTARLDFN